MNPESFNQILHTLSIWGIPVLLAITLHEAGHGYVAKLNGDSTAWMLGRVTLNPLKHIDPFGTLLLPMLLVFMGLPVIGYAKPVPVNFMRLTKYGRRFGTCTVALAGPMANLLLVFVSIALMHISLLIPTYWGEPLLLMAWASVQINILLMTFNLLPILPLDGGRVLEALLPRHLANMFSQTERYGMIIILILVMTQVLFKIISPIMLMMLNLLSGLFPAGLMAGY